MSVTLTFKGLSKSGKYALYSGLRTVTRMSITDFPGNKPVASFTAEGDFAGPREAKRKLTKEERAALPKPTLADIVAKREAALAKLKAKLEAVAV